MPYAPCDIGHPAPDSVGGTTQVAAHVAVSGPRLPDGNSATVAAEDSTRRPASGQEVEIGREAAHASRVYDYVLSNHWLPSPLRPRLALRRRGRPVR
jgi:hypothetical protein